MTTPKELANRLRNCVRELNGLQAKLEKEGFQVLLAVEEPTEEMTTPVCVEQIRKQETIDL